MSFSRGIVVAALLCTPLLAQQPRVLAPHKQFAPKLENQIKGLVSTGQRSMVGGLWRVDPSLKSTIYVRNAIETQAITITPILYLSNGTKLALPDVTVEGGGVSLIDINHGLDSLGISSLATLSGYAELQYQWGWDPFCATIRVSDVAHSLIYTSSLRPTSPPSPKIVNYTPPTPTNVIEGMWWKQNANVTAFVSVANLSSKTASTIVQVSDSEGNSIGGHTVSISPKGMKVLTLPELQATASKAGGIRITSTETSTNLVVNGGLEDQQTGYSANIPFTGDLVPAAKPQQAVVAELDLMSGTADPMMLFPAGTTFTPYSVLRNVSSAPLTVTPTIWWTEGAVPHSALLPQLTLQPHQTKSLDMPALLATYGPKNFNGSFNLVFAGDVQSGVLLMSSGSVDQTSSYVFESTPRGVAESASKSLQYWSTGNGDDTMITVWNPADEPQDFNFTLFFTGGHYTLPLHFEPRATRNFNISEIIQNQVPDAEGNLIPPSVHEGAARLSGSNAENEPILVAVEVGVYNVRKATCSNTCQTCDGYSDSYIIIATFDMDVSTTRQQNFIGVWHSGTQYNWNGYPWTSNATTTATVQGGLVSSVSPGTVGISALTSSLPAYVGYICTGPYYFCPSHQWGGSSSGTVAPTITKDKNLWYLGGNPAPANWSLGSTSVTLTANGATTGRFEWSITAGGSRAQLEGGVQNITKTDANTVGISSTMFSTQQNDVTVRLIYTPSGGSSATRNFNLTIDSPYKLVSTGSTTNTGASNCNNPAAPGSNGFQSLVPYKIMSFLGVQISGIAVNESFTNQVDDYIANTWPLFQAGGTTSPDGNFVDNLCAVNQITPPSLSPQSPLSTVKVTHASQGWFIGSSTPGSGVPVQNNTLQLYQDHGRHESVLSPVR
jgi:hypothetical protein